MTKVYLERNLSIRVATDEEMEDYELAYNFSAIKARLVVMMDEFMEECIIIKDTTGLEHSSNFDNLYDEEFIEIEEDGVYDAKYAGKYIAINNAM